MHKRICVVLAAVMSASLYFAAFNGVAQEEHVGAEKKIVELKMKRRDVLKQRVEVLQTRASAGEIEIMAVIRARDDLYHAELELATVKAKRVKLSQQRFENMIHLEKVTGERYANGVGPIEDKLVATAARLQAEIDFLNEQAAGK